MCGSERQHTWEIYHKHREHNKFTYAADIVCMTSTMFLATLCDEGKCSPDYRLLRRFGLWKKIWKWIDPFLELRGRLARFMKHGKSKRFCDQVHRWWIAELDANWSAKGFRYGKEYRLIILS